MGKLDGKVAVATCASKMFVGAIAKALAFVSDFEA